MSLLTDKRIPETMYMCMLLFIPTYKIVLLIRFFAVITKYTVLDEQRREAKEGKPQRKNPRSITRGANVPQE